MNKLNHHFLLSYDIIVGQDSNLYSYYPLFELIQQIKKETPNIQYIAFIHQIEVDEFKNILDNLYTIYKSIYPYSNEKDFIDDNFSYTIFRMNQFIERDYSLFSTNNSSSKYSYYRYFHPIDKEYIILIIQKDKDINYYKQYFNTIENVLNNYFYNELQNNPTNSNDNKSNFSSYELATIFYYVLCLESDGEVKFNLKKLKGFLSKYDIKKSPQAVKNNFYQVQKDLYELNTFNIKIFDRIYQFLYKNYPKSTLLIEKDKTYLIKNSTDY